MKSRTLSLFGAITLFAALGITAQTSAQGPIFAPAVVYGSGGRYAVSVAVADVNLDGKPDLVVANNYVSATDATGIVGVLLGNGDGTFQGAMTYPSGGLEAQAVAVADVNGDGRPDLVVGNYDSNSIGVLLGSGDGTFQKAVNYPTTGHVRWLVVADVNGDGKPDLVVADNPSVGILLGNGDGTFQTIHTYGSGGQYAISVAVGDVNGDGKLDLLVASGCANANCTDGSMGVLLGNGDGTFQTATTYSSGGFFAQGVAVADVNGDGKADLMVGNFGNDKCNSAATCPYGTVGVLLGNGDGTFQTAATYSSGGVIAMSIATGDVNGDGKLDLLVVNQCADASCASNTVGVLLGNGNGTFQTAVTYDPGGRNGSSLAVADVNGDGKPDLMATNQCAINDSGCIEGSVGVLLNIGDNIPPTTVAIASPGANTNGWNNTNVTVDLNATDNPGGSGVKQIQFSLSGAENTALQTVAGNAASVTISAEGITILTYFATDNAGNQETAKTLTVRIDKTPPVISGLPTQGCSIWPPNHKLVLVATVTAIDTLSGLAPGSFTVTGTSNNATDGQILITGGPSQFLVQLGAEKGLIYTLTATASDLAGNTATLTATCSVPHDQGH